MTDAMLSIISLLLWICCSFLCESSSLQLSESEYDSPNIHDKRFLADAENNIQSTIDTTPVVEDTPIIHEDTESFWPSLLFVIAGICGCICLERLYSSCRRVYQKRKGTLGFSQLGMQGGDDAEEIALGITDSESEDDDDDDYDDDDPNL